MTGSDFKEFSDWRENKMTEPQERWPLTKDLKFLDYLLPFMVGLAAGLLIASIVIAVEFT